MSYWDIGVDEEEIMQYSEEDINEEDRDIIDNLTEINEKYAHLEEGNYKVNEHGDYYIDPNKKLSSEKLKKCRKNAIASVLKANSKYFNEEEIIFEVNPLSKDIEIEDDGFGIKNYKKEYNDTEILEYLNNNILA